MAWICEITVTGDATRSAGIEAWRLTEAPVRLARCKGLVSLDCYAPAADEPHDPYNPREKPPLLILLADFDSEDSLRCAMGGGRMVADLLSAAPQGLGLSANAFRREFYPVGGKAGSLTAPVSYVVRYTRPAEDEALFVREYVDGHPPTQARFPKIRSVMCYFPLRDVAVSGWPARDYLIGNEVVFDSVADFNSAMQSPAREELREHFRAFPAFAGTVSHFLMRRERLRDRTQIAAGALQ